MHLFLKASPLINAITKVTPHSWWPLIKETEKTVGLLLDSGANACLQDKRGNTALMGALIKREIGIAKDLYQAECSPELRNKAGLNLKEFAEIYGQSNVLKSLKY